MKFVKLVSKVNDSVKKKHGDVIVYVQFVSSSNVVYLVTVYNKKRIQEFPHLIGMGLFQFNSY